MQEITAASPWGDGEAFRGVKRESDEAKNTPGVIAAIPQGVKAAFSLVITTPMFYNGSKWLRVCASGICDGFRSGQRAGREALGR